MLWNKFQPSSCALLRALARSCAHFLARCLRALSCALSCATFLRALARILRALARSCVRFLARLHGYCANCSPLCMASISQHHPSHKCFISFFFLSLFLYVLSLSFFPLSFFRSVVGGWLSAARWAKLSTSFSAP